MMNRFLLFCLLCLGNECIAGVNIRNGNFYISYKDVETSGKIKFEITRTYNSRSADNGLFGIGWGSDFEEFVSYTPDGIVSLHHNGSGRLSTMLPVNKKTDMDGFINLIITTGKKYGDISTNPAELAKLKVQLQESADKRRAYYARYREKKWIKETYTPAEGDMFETNDIGHYIITYQKGEFVLTHGETISTFNNLGKITSLTEKGMLQWKLGYEGEKISSLTDGNGNTYKIKMDGGGHITEIKAGKKKATYKYNEKGWLIESADIGANVFKYEWDMNSNLISVTYLDGSAMKMTYHPISQMCTSVKERNGKQSYYDYFNETLPNGAKDDNKYGTRVMEVEDTDTVKYRVFYWMKSNALGMEYLYRMYTTYYNRHTEYLTEYDPNGFVAYKSRMNLYDSSLEQATYRHNAHGNLIYKKTNYYEYSCGYNNGGKLIFIRTQDLENNQMDSTSYFYDENNDLVKVVHDTDILELTYDAKRQITRYKSNESVMLFEYNESKKPIRIEVVGLGYIQVKYDKYNEIEKVDSPSGHKIALEVTSRFQKLLSATKPKGLNYDF